MTRIRIWSLTIGFTFSTLLTFAQGYIGINVDTPSVDFEIRTLSIDDGAEVSVGNMDNSHFARLFSGYPAFPNALLYWKTGHPLLFGTAEEDGSSFSEWMRIDAAGEVGIGTSMPQTDLHIKDPFSVYVSLESDPGHDAVLQLRDADGSPHTGQWIMIRDGSDLGKLQLRHNNISRMTLTPDGDIGIGTVDPLSKLDIQAMGDGAELLRFTTDRPWVFWQRGAGSSTRLALQSTVDHKGFQILAQDSSRVAEFFTTNGGSQVWLVPDGGNVGIGTSNPGNKLRVHGSTTSSQHIISASSNYAGTSTHVRAFEGFSNVVGGYGTGGFFRGGYRGARVYADGSSSTGLSIAIEARATGTTGTRMGVFASAIGGSTNWAGYFAEGHVYVTNQLRIGSGALNGAAGYKVAVDGKVIAEEMRVQLSGSWPDYVFTDSYDLMPLAEVERSIMENKHLPGIPSAREVEEEGILLGDMQARLLEKIEELTLHTIAQEKKIRDLEMMITELRKNIVE